MAEYPQNPNLQYYSPPRAWLSPPAWVEPPPTWMDSSSNSSSDHVPLWVILGLVAAILILLLFIFIYIKRRFKSHKHCRAPPHSVVEKTAAPVVNTIVVPVVNTTVVVPSQHNNHNQNGFGPEHLAAVVPRHCPSCGRSAGLYQFTYTCPNCIYRKDIPLYIDYPTKK